MLLSCFGEYTLYNVKLLITSIIDSCFPIYFEILLHGAIKMPMTSRYIVGFCFVASQCFFPHFFFSIKPVVFVWTSSTEIRLMRIYDQCLPLGMLKSSLRTFYIRHCDLVNPYGMSEAPFVVVSSPCFVRSWLTI